MKKMLKGLGLLVLLTLGATVSLQAIDADGVALVPVPEPASLALLGVGLAGLAGYRAYSKRK